MKTPAEILAKHKAPYTLYSKDALIYNIKIGDMYVPELAAINEALDQQKQEIIKVLEEMKGQYLERQAEFDDDSIACTAYSSKIGTVNTAIEKIKAL